MSRSVITIYPSGVCANCFEGRIILGSPVYAMTPRLCICISTGFLISVNAIKSLRGHLVYSTTVITWLDFGLTPQSSQYCG